MIGQMDPYVQIQIGSVTKKTMVEDEGGKKVYFGATLEFDIQELSMDGQLNELATGVVITVWDKDVLSDDKVGETMISLEQLLSRKGEAKHTIFHNEEKCGEVSLWCYKK